MLRRALLKTWIEVRRRPLLPLLLVATLAVDLFILIHGLQTLGETPLTFGKLGFGQAQVALLAWWVSQPEPHTFWRLACSLALLPMVGLLLELALGAGSYPFIPPPFEYCVGTAAMAFAAVGVGGFGIRWFRDLVTSAPSVTNRRCYSIFDLLGLTTCVAVASVLFVNNRQMLSTFDNLSLWVSVLVESSIALASLALSAWLPRRWAGWVGAAIFLPATLFLLPWVDRSGFLVYAAFNAACCITIALWIAGLRQGPVKRQAFNTQQPSSTPAEAQPEPAPAPVAPIDLTG